LQDPLIDVNITVLDGKLPVIRNEHVKLFQILLIYAKICNYCSICIKLLWCVQGISEDPSKAIVGERSYNHALNLCDEVVLNSLT